MWQVCGVARQVIVYGFLVVLIHGWKNFQAGFLTESLCLLVCLFLCLFVQQKPIACSLLGTRDIPLNKSRHGLCPYGVYGSVEEMSIKQSHH